MSKSKGTSVLSVKPGDRINVLFKNVDLPAEAWDEMVRVASQSAKNFSLIEKTPKLFHFSRTVTQPDELQIGGQISVDGYSVILEKAEIV